MKLCWHKWRYYKDSKTLIPIRICNKCDTKQQLAVVTKGWPVAWPFAKWKKITHGHRSVLSAGWWDHYYRGRKP
ncbi:hypothetical protein LCGC14_1860020 [marine sediment metagenome]|uniref:Uncharacterized protein n=1 Tax=marine sediment metagenome TaxID=412755 RepID=A0A0F9IMA1_9ZZZZ